MGSETTDKAMRIWRSFRTKAIAGVLFGVVMAACYKVLHEQPIVQNTTEKDAVNPVYVKLPLIEPDPDSDPLDLSEFSNCTRKPPMEHPRPKEEWSKTMYLAAPNFALSDSAHKDLINQLTGLAHGGKSFYASSNQVRHCVGTTETATCSIGTVGPKNNDAFSSKYMFVIRNPKSLFPFAANSKGILYHGLTGQTPIEEWRLLRDTYLTKMMGEWVSDIKDWMKADYEIGLYIVYEDLLDIQNGPNVVRQIANLLKEGGFSVVDDDHIPCVWYTSIGEKKIQHYHKYKYDFGEYIPGFTNDQKELMISSLNDFIDEIKDGDKDLASILTRYVNNISTGTVIDEKWKNKTSLE